LKLRKRILSLICCAAVLCLFTVAVFAQPTQGNNRTTVLFTHDLHSHLLPAADEEGGGQKILDVMIEFLSDYEKLDLSVIG